MLKSTQIILFQLLILISCRDSGVASQIKPLSRADFYPKFSSDLVTLDLDRDKSTTQDRLVLGLGGSSFKLIDQKIKRYIWVADCPKGNLATYCMKGGQRGLNSLQQRMGSTFNLSMFLESNFAGRHAKVLEVGAGSGRLLLDIKKILNDAKLVGLNKPGESVPLDFVEVNNFFQIFPKESFAEMAKDFHEDFIDIDKEKLSHYKDNSLDFIVSQSAIQYMNEKLIVIEDIYRKLKKGGAALLHVSGLDIVDQAGRHITPMFLIENFNSQQIPIMLLDNRVLYFEKNGPDIDLHSKLKDMGAFYRFEKIYEKYDLLKKFNYYYVK